MKRSVLKRGNPLLYRPSQAVTNNDEAGAVVADLWDTLKSIQKLYAFSRGSGIAAPQIGRLLRISVVQFEDRRYTLINPKIIAHSAEKMLIPEGCLSFFKYRGKVERYVNVTVQAFDISGKSFTVNAKGDFASLLQHELDHLDGILYDSQLAPGQTLYEKPGMPVIP